MFVVFCNIVVDMDADADVKVAASRAFFSLSHSRPLILAPPFSLQSSGSARHQFGFPFVRSSSSSLFENVDFIEEQTTKTELIK